MALLEPKIKALQPSRPKYDAFLSAALEKVQADYDDRLLNLLSMMLMQDWRDRASFEILNAELGEHIPDCMLARMEVGVNACLIDDMLVSYGPDESDIPGLRCPVRNRAAHEINYLGSQFCYINPMIVLLTGGQTADTLLGDPQAFEVSMKDKRCTIKPPML
jgi:hypothetical protein